MASIHENDETVAMGASEPTITPRPSAASELPRFAPGTLLARRYRIVSKLGKGGMGEVYRADDIVLGQTVALKFLPEAAQTNPNLPRALPRRSPHRAADLARERLPRLRHRRDRRPAFLSMEYIDGEDLVEPPAAHRPPAGRQGARVRTQDVRRTAAAHAQGVLHRDIKPGNIMIDGRGESRITDFGLAALGSAIEGNEIRVARPRTWLPSSSQAASLRRRAISTRSASCSTSCSPASLA